MPKYESLPYNSNFQGDSKFERDTQDINDLLLPTDDAEEPETTRDRIIKGFRIGDPNMPFTYEIADALRRANRSIGLRGGQRPPAAPRHRSLRSSQIRIPKTEQD